MSNNSFDESSNLVVEVTSPTDKDGDFDSQTPDVEKSDLREKSKGGLGFIKKRAKSPFRSPLKSPIKSPLKSPFKSSKSSSKASKSPSKSPTEELLSQDVKEIEQKISEKNSDEWKAFQQMQDRIRQNVLKSQTSLSKLSSDKTADGQEGSNGVKPKKKTDSSSWQNYDDTSSLITVENNEKQNNAGHSYISYEENLMEGDMLEVTDNIQQLSVTPIPSPRGTPKPPANSLRTSMENLMSEEMGASTKTSSNNDFVDLLGLSVDSEISNTAVQDDVNFSYINQDLLGLDSFISSTEPQQGGSMCSSIQSYSNQSSQRTTPLGFDDSLWGTDSTQSGVVASSFVSDMVDEFLQLDTMKEASVNLSLNPFETSASKKKTNTLSAFDPFGKIESLNAMESQKGTMQNINPLTQLSSSSTSQSVTQGAPDSLDPFAAPIPGNKMAGNENMGDIGLPTDTDGAPMFDPFNGCKHNTFGRANSPHVYDNLGFGLVDPKQGENGENYQQETDASVSGLSDSQTKSVDATNPFLSFTEKDVAHEVKADLFDENFLEYAVKGKTDEKSSNVWGMENTDTTDGGVQSNPFQDDIFSTDFVNVQAEIKTKNQVQDQLNPFLTNESSLTQTAVTTEISNPFLDFDSGSQITKEPQISDVDQFLIGDGPAVANKIVKSPTLNDFDPFGVSHGNEKGEIISDMPTDDMFSKAALSGEGQLVEPDDDDQALMLEIKPLSLKLNEEGRNADIAPPPALKPPPRPPRSPQPPRENPFDRDSPPEEDFAKFEIMHDEADAEEQRQEGFEHSMSFSTTESTTPEEELNLEPLEPFYPGAKKEGWNLMLRQPTKKKLTSNRYWKNVYIKIVKQEDGPVLKLYNDSEKEDSFQELPLQPCYSMSDVALQHYDQYGKIHTVKLQYIFYRERVGIKADRLTPSFVKKPKPTMILNHSPQVSEMMKFGCLSKEDIHSFVREIENAIMNLEAHREKTLTYVKEEVSSEVWDEYHADLDKEGKMITQKARVRVFFLAFITGMPTCEIGLNDKRRRGKEVVGRQDIIPIKTEEWIRLEDVEFHCCVHKDEFEKTNNIRFHPLDACQFELLRYRVRLRENKELPLQLKIQQIMKESKCEIRCDLLVTGYHSFSKKHGQFPCEDIEVHFPIPEPWIYLFRYERRFGYGSFKSATRKPGKIKGLERITMIAQGLLTPTLMEADVGTAKYEHVYRAVVWRIPRLPERNEGAYTSHLFRMTLDLGVHDEVPETFEKYTTVDFTMPSCTVSQSQVRSISVENPTPPEKWVRYIAKYHYKIEIDHIREGGAEKDASPENSD